jgi:excisionase family DNA binding protein
MQSSFSLDALLSALANAVADKVAQRLPATSSPSIQPRLLSVEQAATYIGRSKAAVQHMIATKRLPVVRDGHRVFLDIRELDRWIEANTQPGDSGA